ncbi:tetratricopeptide repeat protein, partial [bacterium]|nr:tetratricopeptide repeat protein [bacterium]
MEITLNQALKRAQEFKSDGKFQEADKIYTLIIKKFPGQTTASIQLADIALKYRKPNISYRLILDAIRANAESEPLWIFLSLLLKDYSTDLVPKSECFCRQTSEFKILPSDEKLVSLVKKELRKSNTGVIIDKCERLLKRNTVTEYTVVTLARCYQLKGMMTKEQELLTKYCEILKTSSRLRFMLSNNLLLQKKYSQALCEAAWLIGQYPKYAHVLQVIGIALQEIAKISASIEFLKLALELDGADSNSLTAMGDAYRLSTRYDQAKEFYLKAVDAKPDNVTAEINLGLAYRKLGQYKEALDIYFKLADAKNVDVNIYNNIGALYFDQGDLTQAQKYLKEAIIRFPNDGSAHRHLTLSRKYTGNEKQIDTLLTLVENDQVKEDSKLQARFALGKIFDDLGDYENAFQNFLIGNTIKKKLSKY